MAGGVYTLYIQRSSRSDQAPPRQDNTSGAESLGDDETGSVPKNEDEDHNGQIDPGNSAGASLPDPDDDDGPAQQPQPEDLQDVFVEEIIPHFTSIEEFTEFAESKNGLGLNTRDVSDIKHKHDDVYGQKMAMLSLWKQNNAEDATVSNIRNIMRNYTDGVMPADVPDTLQDVFRKKIIPAFADLEQFKKFAESKDGLGLEHIEIEKITHDYKNMREIQMALLDKWRQRDLYDVDPKSSIEKILKIKNTYLERKKNLS